MTEQTGPELDLGLPPQEDKQHPFAGLLGEYLTITNPANGSTWTGRVIAYHDDPCVVIETADGTHICLPQAFTITAAEAQHAEPEQLPDGEYATVQIMGHDEHTGWVTESTRAGQPVMVIRDWDGRVIAEVPGHSLYRFLPLATPLKRPEPRQIHAGYYNPLALEADRDDGDPWHRGDEGDYDDDGSPF